MVYIVKSIGPYHRWYFGKATDGGEGCFVEHVGGYAFHVLSDFQAGSAAAERCVVIWVADVAAVGAVVVDDGEVGTIVECVITYRGHVFADCDLARQSGAVVEGSAADCSREYDGGASGEAGAVLEGAAAHVGQFVCERQCAGESRAASEGPGSDGGDVGADGEVAGEARAVPEGLVTDGGHGIRDGEVARKAVACSESVVANRGHAVAYGQCASIESRATFEGRVADNSNGIRDG